jgi:hypothetical protein
MPMTAPAGVACRGAGEAAAHVGGRIASGGRLATEAGVSGPRVRLLFRLRGMQQKSGQPAVARCLL